jgi:hypothetical protein
MPAEEKVIRYRYRRQRTTGIFFVPVASMFLYFTVY